MTEKAVPNYDYSFLKKLNKTFYTDFNDLIEAYLSNIQASIFQIANGLFEKGLKYFLDKEGKLDSFFNEDPNLTKMVLSFQYPESRNYIRSRISIDYDLLVYVRNSANSKKHDLSEDNPALNKALILTELFSLFVQVHNYYYTPAIDMPSKEYIEYVSSFNEYKDHKLEDIDKEIQKRLEKAELEIKSKLISAEVKLAEKQNQINAAGSKLNEVQSEIERTGSLLDEANARISAAEDLLKTKAQEAKELDEYLVKRKAEIVLTESSQANNDLYELGNSFLSEKDFDAALRVFKSIQNSNIRDLRAFLGIILCQYKARTIDELLSFAVSCKRSLKDESIFGDIKFLKEADKLFIIDIANKIDTDILYNHIHSLIFKEQFDKALKFVQDSKASDYDKSALINYIQEARYQKASELLMQKNFDEAISLFSILNGYKGSKELLNLAKEEREIARQLEAENDPTIDNYNKDIYEIEGTILKKYIALDNCTKSEIKVPRGITIIYSNAFQSCKNIKSVVLPNSVIRIGYDAFRDCNGLTYIEIPNSVISIGESAFSGCSSLKHIKIPNSVSSISKSAFTDCKNLESIEIPSNITVICRGAFARCLKLQSVIIPNSVTSIDVFAFEGCTDLKSVIIPNSVTTIGAGAFSYCNNLTHIEIPSSVTTIGDAIFEGCQNLSKVTIGSGVKSISANAFQNCISLTDIQIPNSVTSISFRAFDGCKNLKNVTLPNSIITIKSTAFARCENLTSIVIPDGVTSIGDYTFFYCSNLTSIIIPDSVTSIGILAFSHCDKLESVIIGKGVKALSLTFEDCRSLKSIILPPNISWLYSYTFKDCINLTHVEICGSPYIDIFSCPFEGCNNLKMIIYHGTKSQWEERLKKHYLPPLKGISIKCSDGIINSNN